VIVDHSWIKSKPIQERQSIYQIDTETGKVLSRNGFHSSIRTVFFPRNKDEVFLLYEDESMIYHYLLNPSWNNPATITPSTNYIQFGEGDNAKFTVNIRNEYDFSQDVTAYMWLYAPDGTMLFFDGSSLTTNIIGIPLTLPANLDITGDILAFTMPAGVPEGFYNFNAVLINENGDRGPVGTWNFYIKD